MENYEPVIGLEIHVELLTESKMFCGCSTKFGAPPNTQVCPVCSGMPGVLPVLNATAVELGLKAAIALNCDISKKSRFARKNYYYPDLPKNYQISQFEEPLAKGGRIEVEGDTVKLTRIHLEEDAGKLIHPENQGSYSLVDLNRSSLPLLEIVTEPDIKSGEQAEKFLLILKRVLEYLAISDCNMEEGSLRCDANISVKKSDSNVLGTKTEIKNMNSFKAVRKAIEYEAKRQGALLKRGGEVIQETRLWKESMQITESMRSKEGSQDYRYFPDPDLIPVSPEDDTVSKIKAAMGELPYIRRDRFIEEFKLSFYDADVLTSKKEIADYFEDCVSKLCKPKLVANWVMGELTAMLKSNRININSCPVTSEYLVELLGLLEEKKITQNTAKNVLRESFNTSESPVKIVSDKNLISIQDEDMISSIVNETIKENPSAVNDFIGGNEKSIMFLMGQVMRKTSGNANPAIVQRMLRESLNKPEQLDKS